MSKTPEIPLDKQSGTPRTVSLAMSDSDFHPQKGDRLAINHQKPTRCQSNTGVIENLSAGNGGLLTILHCEGCEQIEEVLLT